MNRFRWLGFLLVTSLCTASCSSGDDGDERAGFDTDARMPECVPGEQRGCECDRMRTGVRECDDTGQWDACRCLGEPAPGLAGSVRIREVAAFQVVKISLAVDGELVLDRNAPVVEGKELMLRVYVDPLEGFEPRELRAELTLRSSSELVQSMDVTQRIEGASRDGVLDSTLNFQLPAAMVTADLEYAVTLREVDGEPRGTSDPNARFPIEEDRSVELGARYSGSIRVVLVPFRYMFDGSGRLPAVSGENAEVELDLFRRVPSALYPISGIEVTLHEPVDYAAELTPIVGWEELLATMCELRAAEDADPELFYYGLIAPVEGWGQYPGGTVGISNVPFASGEGGRCSVGIGFPGGYGTAIHELGHALGRPHAPCGTAGEAFPYPEGKIGVWGYGTFSQSLKDPETNYDLMGYCSPPYISDYTYGKLFERIRFINQEQHRIPGPRLRFTQLLVRRDGSTRWRTELSLRYAPGGREHERELELLDAGGNLTQTVTAYFFPYSEAPAGMWFVPPLPEDVVAVRASGLGLVRLP